jgi:hypothetical protein
MECGPESSGLRSNSREEEAPELEATIVEHRGSNHALTRFPISISRFGIFEAGRTMQDKAGISWAMQERGGWDMHGFGRGKMGFAGFGIVGLGIGPIGPMGPMNLWGAGFGD